MEEWNRFTFLISPPAKESQRKEENLKKEKIIKARYGCKSLLLNLSNLRWCGVDSLNRTSGLVRILRILFHWNIPQSRETSGLWDWGWIEWAFWVLGWSWCILQVGGGWIRRLTCCHNRPLCLGLLFWRHALRCDFHSLDMWLALDNGTAASDIQTESQKYLHIGVCPLLMLFGVLGPLCEG